MADVNQIYQGEFLRAQQLKGQARRAMIEAAVVEMLGQGEKSAQKIVLKLAKVKPRLPLNKTNAQAIAAAYGPQTENWIGREIELRPEKVMFSGALVDAIRVHPVKSAPPAPAAAAPAADAGDSWEAEAPPAVDEDVL
jgi:hypothetical protein